MHNNQVGKHDGVRKLIFSLLLGCIFANGADVREATVRQMLEAHRWFDLREAVDGGKPPALNRGFVAAAFNGNARAERELQSALRAGATRERQFAVHEALFHLNLRSGLYRQAAIKARKKWALYPETSPPEGERDVVQVFERLPDVAVVSRKQAAVSYTTWPGGQIVTPLVINMSVITEAEAKRLGTSVLSSEVSAAGITGTPSPGAHMAVAERLQVGGTELRNVTFLVVRDEVGKFMEYPVGERGALGLPVMLAL